MLPAATARRPPAVSISAIRVVTVVLPLVPVTATSGRPRAAAATPASSISERTARRVPSARP